MQVYTYTMCARSSGFSGCSGKTGCGGSLEGTQPKDLLIAWLSFFAGDFCVKGENKEMRSFRVQIRFHSSQGDWALQKAASRTLMSLAASSFLWFLPSFYHKVTLSSYEAKETR